jgi:hypothetical protein
VEVLLSHCTVVGTGDKTGLQAGELRHNLPDRRFRATMALDVNAVSGAKAEGARSA